MRFKMVRIGDYLSLVKGISYTSANLVTESTQGLLTINAFKLGGGFKPQSEKPFAGNIPTQYLLSDGDVLLAMTEQDFGLLASPLVINMAETKFGVLTYSLDVAKVEIVNEGLLPEFLFNVLRIPAFRIRASYGDAGSTVQRLPYNVLLDQMVPCPDLLTQQAIIRLTKLLDDKIRLNGQLAKTLEDIAQTIFKSWFIDFDPVKAKMAGEKPFGMDATTAALFPDSMEDSELGLIPNGWASEVAEDVFDITIGRTPPRKEPGWFCDGDTGVPWVSIRDMGGFSTYSNLTREGLTREAVSKFRVPVVPDGTVLMSFKLTVGKLCITDGPLVTNEAIAHFVVPSNSKVTNYFAYLWLSNHDMNSLDSTSSIGTATNSGIIKKIRFLIPSEEAMRAFSTLCAPVFLQIKNIGHENNSLISLRDSLLPRLISGELQIPEEMLVS